MIHLLRPGTVDVFMAFSTPLLIHPRTLSGPTCRCLASWRTVNVPSARGWGEAITLWVVCLIWLRFLMASISEKLMPQV
jgi:hypothetical protein